MLPLDCTSKLEKVPYFCQAPWCLQYSLSKSSCVTSISRCRVALGLPDGFA